MEARIADVLFKQFGVVRHLGCPFSSAWCLVCEVFLSAIVLVDCRCSLSFVFLRGAGVGGFLPVKHQANYCTMIVSTATARLRVPSDAHLS